MRLSARPDGLSAWTCCAASANERPPNKADTDVQTHAPALESGSVHAVPAAPECPFIGHDDPAANNVGSIDLVEYNSTGLSCSSSGV
eukprot:3991508-Prymnesium_polylepis.1